MKKIKRKDRGPFYRNWVDNLLDTLINIGIWMLAIAIGLLTLFIIIGLPTMLIIFAIKGII